MNNMNNGATMKRYAVMGFAEYYPGGGFDDLQGLFDTLDDAIAFAKDCGERIVEVWDTSLVAPPTHGSGARAGLVWTNYEPGAYLSTPQESQ